MLITGVRTLTTAPAAPALSSSVSGSTASLSWTPPTLTGQSVIAGYRVYKAAAIGGPYTQVGGSLPSGQTSLTDSLSGTQFYKVEAFDQFVTGGRSAGVQCVPVTGSMVWVPGFIARTGAGNYSIPTGTGAASGSGNLAFLFACMDAVIAADTHNVIKHFCFPMVWALLEGPTLGLYDGSWGTNRGFNLVQQIINKCKSYSPPRGVMISLNQTGNGSGANTNAAFPASFAPAYLASSTYGGGCEWAGLSGYTGYPNVNTTMWLRATALRVAAMVKAYYAQFGPFDPVTGNGIYMWELTNEIALQFGTTPASALTNASLVDAIINGYGTIRTGAGAAPDIMLTMRPTFVHPETPAGYTAILNAMLNAKIAMGNEDGSNNFSGTNAKSSWSDRAYAGRNPGTNVVDPTMIDYTQINVFPHVFNVENAEYGKERTPLGGVPADVGSGYFLDTIANPGILTGANTLGSAHCILFMDTQDGPNNNRFKFPVTTGQSPNPSGSPGAGLTSAHPNLMDVLNGNYAGASGIVTLENLAPPPGW